MWTTGLAHHDVHQEDINASHLRSSRGTWSMPRALNLPHSVASTCEPRPVVHRRGRSRALAHPSGPSSEHDGFSSCDHRDLNAASRTSRTTLLALQVSAEQSVGWMTAMPSSPPIRPIQIGPQEAAKTLTDDCSALSWTQELGLTCLESRRTSRVERATMLLAALRSHRA